MDGSSGILDNSREIKMRIKAFAYVYRMTNDTKWVDRAWEELQVSVFNIFMGVLTMFLIRMLPEMGQQPLVRRLTNGTVHTSSMLQK
jgi:hypothetical protein